jgi:hypothetical protein
MRSRWTEALTIAWAISGAVPGEAQVKEIGIQAVGTASSPALLVVGPIAGVRLSERTRLSLAAGLGIRDHEVGWRGEALGHFLLSPAKRRGWGAYVAGGLAAAGGSVSNGYLVLTLGLEERPGASSGWALEAGVGGGARLSAGYRWRWMSRTAP